MISRIFSPALFQGSVIIVTGAASGIGLHVTEDLCRLGARVVMVGRNERKLRVKAQKLSEQGLLIDYYSCDITCESDVNSLVSEVVSSRGQIHGLVNNAGGQFVAPLENISKAGFSAIVEVNLIGGFVLAREVFRQSMKHYGGSIVNIIADMASGMPGSGHSGAARAGMENFTKTAAIEWGEAGVRVNAVAPGIIKTKGFEKYYPVEVKSYLEQYAKPSIPLKRFGLTADVSTSIAFLLSKAASYISGQTLRINGGKVLHGNFWPFPSLDLEEYVPLEYLKQ